MGGWVSGRWRCPPSSCADKDEGGHFQSFLVILAVTNAVFASATNQHQMLSGQLGLRLCDSSTDPQCSAVGCGTATRGRYHAEAMLSAITLLAELQ